MCTAVAIKEILMAFRIAVALIEFCSCCGKIDERNIHLLCHKLHLIRIVHRMVALWHALSAYRTICCEHREAVAEVMTTVTANLFAVEVAAAHWRNKDRVASQRTCFLNILAKIFLICSGRNRTAGIYLCSLCGIADALVVCFQGITIHTTVLLVVMCKLYQHIVAWLHILLHCTPTVCLFIESARIASATSVIYRCHAIQELLEIHAPATCHCSCLIIWRHG